MARKKNRKEDPEERKTAESYYKLHSQAVNDLVTANEENSPVVPEEELRKYRSGSKIRISDTLKALLIKAWFNGSVCFFFFWGLGSYLRDLPDQLMVLGFAQGVITDLLVNNVLRFIASSPGANDRWMMFPKKGFITLPLNILYAYLLLFLVVTTYNVLNLALLQITGATEGTPLGVEPVLFGVFTTAWDTLLIKIKHTAQSVLADARRSAAKGE